MTISCRRGDSPDSPCRSLFRPYAHGCKGWGIGFSLVELLVVLAIVSVLAAMLLSTLEQSISSARTAVCVSNLRQIGLALRSYADEQRDIIMPYRFGNASYWTGRIAPYLGSSVGGASGLNCPTGIYTYPYAPNCYVSWNLYAGDKIRRFRDYKAKPEQVALVMEGNSYYQRAFNNAVGTPSIQLRHDDRFALLYVDLHAQLYPGTIGYGTTEYVSINDGVFWHANLGWAW